MLLIFQKKDCLIRVFSLAVFSFVFFAYFLFAIQGVLAQSSNPTLVGYWRFDDGAGVIANDSSGNGNHGTLVNGPLWVDGKFGKALKFDSVNKQSVFIGNNPIFNFDDRSFSIALWVKYMKCGDCDLLRKGSTSTASRSYKVEVKTNKLGFVLNIGGTSKILRAPSSSNDDLWHLLVAVRDTPNNLMKLYIDGQLVASKSNLIGSLSNSANLTIGSKDTMNDDFFNGTIDDVMMFNRSLSDAEIQQLYEGSSSVCGNNIKEGVEQCDGTDLSGQSCITQGFSGGNLSCTSSCTFNTSACYAAVCIDNDGDKYNQSATGCGIVDCNDNNAAINPGASEICGDGVDNNCNGLIDEGCSVPNQIPLVCGTASGSLADDPAFWINQTNPEESLVIIAFKGGELRSVLAKNCSTVKSITGLSRPNNVDVEYGLLVNGVPTDIAVMTERYDNSLGVFSLPDLIRIGRISTILPEPMGVALYKNSSGDINAFVSAKNPTTGTIQQYRLDGSSGSVTGTLVRRFGDYTTEVEAISVDKERERAYVSHETQKIDVFDTSGNFIQSFGQSGFSGQREGSAVYACGAERYSIISDQGGNDFQVYNISNNYSLIGAFTANGTSVTDGIDIKQETRIPNFPSGIFAAQNNDVNVNLYHWSDIASRLGLSICTESSDTTPPQLSIVSPENNSSIEAIVEIFVNATDNKGIAKVELYKDGILFASDSMEPYSFIWNTQNDVNGIHLISARALDTSNNEGWTNSTFIINNTITSFAFAAAGDHGYNNSSTGSTRLSLQALNASGVDFYLALGDLSYSNDNETNWCNFVKSEVGTLPFELVSGNHEDDLATGGGFIGNFASCLPDKLNSSWVYAAEYYFDYHGIARIIMISPDLSVFGTYYDYSSNSPHYIWLTEKIDEARILGIPWVIVGMHKVCISSGDKTCEIGSDLMNLLIEKKVDLVLQAHAHNYQRSKQLKCASPDIFNSSCINDDGSDNKYTKGNGSVFVIDGAFGHSIRDIDLTDQDAQYFAAFMGNNMNPTYGFVKYNLTKTSLYTEYVGVGPGNFSDSFSILAPIPDTTSPSIPTDVNAIAINEFQINLTWNDSLDPESGISYYKIYRDNANIGQSTITSFSDAGLLESTTYIYEISAVNSNNLESAKSSPINATTLPETTPPNISSVIAENATLVRVIFSEPVSEVTAEDINNYNISSGILISSALLETDTKTVLLMTSQHQDGVHTITINNIQDRAKSPNIILGNSQFNYTVVSSHTDANLVGYWRFDNGTATDDSGSGNNGTVSGAVWTANGKVGGAFGFDGVNDVIDLGDVLNLDLPVTMSAWIKPTSLAGTKGKGVIGSDRNTNAAYDGYWMTISSTNWAIEIGFGDGGGQGSVDRREKIGTTSLNNNTWYHVVGVIRGANDMDIYINGVNDNGTHSGSGGAMSHPTEPFQIGGFNLRTTTTTVFNGTIDEVQIWDRALSSEEIIDFYSS